MFRCSPLDHRSLSYPQLPPDMDCDEAWRAMTEEEESLAQEEQSLKKEIEEVRESEGIGLEVIGESCNVQLQAENLSIDAELERQVAAEAGELELRDSNEETDDEQVDSGNISFGSCARNNRNSPIVIGG